MILIGLYTQEEGISWWSSRRTWRSMDMRGTRCLRFRSDPERTCKWTVCLTLDFSLCDWFLLNIYLCGGGEFILLRNALLWDVRAQGLYIDGYQTHGVNCLCGMPKWQMIKASVEKQSLVVDDQSTTYVAALCITWIREPHTSVWVKNGIVTAGRARRFFLASGGVSA